MKKLLLILCLVTTSCYAQLALELVPGTDSLRTRAVVIIADTDATNNYDILGFERPNAESYFYNGRLRLGTPGLNDAYIKFYGTVNGKYGRLIYYGSGSNVDYILPSFGGTVATNATPPLAIDAGTGTVSLDTTVITGTAYGMSLKKGIGDSLTYLTGNATTTSTSATRVSGLTVTMAANEKWAFHAVLKIGSSSVAGCKYAVDIPPGALMYVTFFGTTSAAGTYTTEWITTDATLSSTAFDVAGITTAAVGAFLTIDGIIVNDANAGNFEIMHAKVTSGTATIYAGSYLQAWKQN